MNHPYKKVFIIRNSDNIPLHSQEPMALQEAINRYNREIATDKKLGIHESDRDYNIYDIERNEVILW